MNISLISKITLATVATSLTSLIITPSVLAFSFSLDGTFDDGGTLGGTFDFDENTDIYSNLNINSTGGSTLSGSTYTDDLLISGDSSTGFVITDDSLDFDLTLDFVTALSSTSGAIALDTTSQEEDFLTGTRLLSSGTVTPVAVPFEPSANLGIVTLGGIWGLTRLAKRKRAKNNL